MRIPICEFFSCEWLGGQNTDVFAFSALSVLRVSPGRIPDWSFAVRLFCSLLRLNKVQCVCAGVPLNNHNNNHTNGHIGLALGAPLSSERKYNLRLRARQKPNPKTKESFSFALRGVF